MTNFAPEVAGTFDGLHHKLDDLALSQVTENGMEQHLLQPDIESAGGCGTNKSLPSLLAKTSLLEWPTCLGVAR